MYMGFVWGFNCSVCAITGRCKGIGVQEWVLLEGVIGPGVALGIVVVGTGLRSHFLRKWRFLSVILPDLLTLIWYWRSGWAVMIFPIVFHL